MLLPIESYDCRVYGFETALYVFLVFFFLLIIGKQIFTTFGILYLRRDGRVVECGGLENRCSPSGEPGVRIPLSPQTKLLPQHAAGFLIHSWPNKACLNEDRYELKILMSETNKGVIWDARFPPGITESNPPLSANLHYLIL
jgi:hypothetical protein